MSKISPWEHPLVLDSRNRASNILGISVDNITPFSQGGIGLIFIIKQPSGDKAILKIPSFSKRPVEDFEILKHNIFKEGEILRAANCNMIPKLFLLDSYGNFLVREYIEGHTLSAIVNFSSIDYRKKLLLLLIKSSCILFETIHNHNRGNYVIRDFKPINLIVSSVDSQLMYLIDVGSFRQENDMISKTNKEDRVGSGKWLYWSPEQLLENSSNLDRRTDYFSFGATAYYILTGKAPYSNSIRVRNQVLSNYFLEYDCVIKNIKQCAEVLHIPTKLVDLIICCLHPNPKERNFEDFSTLEFDTNI
jgi:serine/threonine-protein kinase